MADLPEVNEWPEGIYQLETSDPVLGGPEGIDNLQGKQLANRTKWLRDQIEKIVQGVTSIGKAARLETARALKFKGAATGSGDFDGSADTEITLTLVDSGVSAGTYPKITVNAKGLVVGGASLVASDLPEGITAPQFDNDKSYATTEFVQRALGNDSGVSILLGVTTLNASHAGKLIYAGAGGNYTVTLPSAAAVPAGTKLPIVMFASQPCFIATQLAQLIYFNGSQTLSNITLGLGDSLTVESDGANWYAVGGSAQLKYAAVFGSSLGANGYQKLPNGLIIQWGLASGGTGALAALYPIAFPGGVFQVVATMADKTGGSNSGVTLFATAVNMASKTTVTLLPNGSDGLGASSARYIAIGY
ncbi:gp53-like domain-containing protein [Pseudomonas neuropathica]